MNKIIKTLLRRLTGIVLLLLGFAGLVLPGLQGILMIVGGLLILFPEETALGKKIRQWLKENKDHVRKKLVRQKRNQSMEKLEHRKQNQSQDEN
jgi:hypothetical protein